MKERSGRPQCTGLRIASPAPRPFPWGMLSQKSVCWTPRFQWHAHGTGRDHVHEQAAERYARDELLFAINHERLHDEMTKSLVCPVWSVLSGLSCRVCPRRWTWALGDRVRGLSCYAPGDRHTTHTTRFLKPYVSFSVLSKQL